VAAVAVAAEAILLLPSLKQEQQAALAVQVSA
jgi:hypothetical protein